MRKYTFNYNYFNSIDSEYKAYWLGFLYADGSLSEERNTLSISLAESDRQHLYKFAKSIDLDRPINKTSDTPRTPNSQLIYKIEVTHNNIKEDLIKLGCMGNKTFKLKFPNTTQVPEHLIRHFIRGYFDGDGSIWFHYSKKFPNMRPTFSFGIVGTENIINHINKILIELNIHGLVSIRHPERNNNIRQLTGGGNYCTEKFLDYIYKDTNIYLDRKFILYSKLKKLNSVPLEIPVKQIDCNDKIIKIWPSVREAAAFFKTHQNTITNVINGNKIKKNDKIYIRKTYKGFKWEYCKKIEWREFVDL